MAEYTVNSLQNFREKYFVLSDGDTAYRLVFSLVDAIHSRSQYIDSFDENGSPVKAYFMIQDNVYTDKF